MNPKHKELFRLTNLIAKDAQHMRKEAELIQTLATALTTCIRQAQEGGIDDAEMDDLLCDVYHAYPNFRETVQSEDLEINEEDFMTPPPAPKKPTNKTDN